MHDNMLKSEEILYPRCFNDVTEIGKHSAVNVVGFERRLFTFQSTDHPLTPTKTSYPLNALYLSKQAMFPRPNYLMKTSYPFNTP